MLALSRISPRAAASAPAAAEVLVKDPGWRRLVRKPEAWAARLLEAALAAPAVRAKAAGLPLAVSFCLAGDPDVRNLNREFRGQDAPTNVLAFPSGEAGFLGDVVLALGAVKAEAAAQKKPARDHAAHLMVHGVLHLLGFRHDRAREAEAMERLEAEILASLGIADPYRAERP